MLCTNLRTSDFPDDMHKVMASCHAHDADKRPSFAEIVAVFEPVLAAMTKEQEERGEEGRGTAEDEHGSASKDEGVNVAAAAAAAGIAKEPSPQRETAVDTSRHYQNISPGVETSLYDI